MNLSRRAFVGGAAAFGVAVAAPKFAFAEPSAAEKQAEADAALQKLLKLNSDLDQKVKDYAAAVDARQSCEQYVSRRSDHVSRRHSGFQFVR